MIHSWLDTGLLFVMAAAEVSRCWLAWRQDRHRKATMEI